MSSVSTRRFKVNGVSYTVTTDADGVEVYDPPLRETTREWFGRGKKDLRSGCCPKLGKTDTGFHANRMSMRDQFQGDEPWLRRFDKEYRKQTGQALPSDAVWMGQLAESQFDAKAVITPSMGQADVNKLIERKADRAKREADAPPIRLAEDLVQDKMRMYRGEGDKSSDAELRHNVIEKHGQKV